MTGIVTVFRGKLSRMGRKRLELGEHGEITVIRQKLDCKRWMKVDRGGDRWKARTMFRKHDGTDIELTGYAATKAAAEAAVQQKINAQRGQVDEKITGRTLLVDVGAQWLKDIQRPDSGLSARSIDDYSRTFRRYIDAPGSSLRALTIEQADDPQTITRFLRHVADSHGVGAVKQSRVVLTHLFRVAVQARALKSSPMKDVPRVQPAVAKATERDVSRAFTREERDEVVRLPTERRQSPGTIHARSGSATPSRTSWPTSRRQDRESTKLVRSSGPTLILRLGRSRCAGRRRRARTVQSTSRRGCSTGCVIARNESAPAVSCLPRQRITTT
jgi:hypothetical protein